jgi:eukaryotic-like serine/threonine-protein kinase
MARLMITTLGSLQVTLDEEPVTTFAYDKVRALLIYLVDQQDRPLHRDLLADLLWPHQETSGARKQLRSALATLRAAIDDGQAEPPFLLISRDSLQFNGASAHWYDVTQFMRPLQSLHGQRGEAATLNAEEAAALAQSVALYRGGFLEQLAVRDSPPWEEWVAQRREALHRQACAGLWLLAQHHELAGRYEQAQQYARQLLVLEPWDEAAYRCVMRGLAKTGQRAAALQQYEQLRKVLADELGVAPSAESLALQQQLLANEFMVADPPLTAPGTIGGRVFSPAERAVEVAPTPVATVQAVGQGRRADRNQQRMLERVRRFWIDGVLERSLHNRVLLTLGLAYEAEATQQPWHLLFQSSDAPPQPLPPQSDVLAVYDQLEGELLILGAPGAGKTTTLLHLARSLLQRAEADAHMAMPIIFHLSSWATQSLPISQWLVQELRLRYQVPRRMAEGWVSEGLVLPLLDGLDEVVAEQRAACVAAINQFREEHWLLGTVVCSRISDYATLGVRLHLRGAVVVQPLSSEQIAAYVQQGGEQLAAVRRLLAEDRLLHELANTPLMLSIIVMAYHGAPTTTVPRLSSLDARRRHLFATYTQRMLVRRTQQRYPPKQTMSSLIWLARAMIQRSQSVFLIEDLQPSWLDEQARQRYVAIVLLIISLLVGLVSGISNGIASAVLGGSPNILVGLLVGVAGGLLSGLLAWLVVWPGERLLRSNERWGDLAQPRWWQGLLRGLPLALAMGLVVVLTVGVGYSPGEGLAFGTITMVASLLFLALMRQTGPIHLVEGYRWSLARAWHGLLPGAVLGAAVGLGLGISYWATAGLASGLVLLLGSMFVFGLTSQGLEQTSVPNQGIWRTGRHALSIGLAVGLIATCVHGIVNGMSQGQAYGLAVGITAGLNDMILGGIITGGIACIRHVVVRLLLWRKGVMPWHYARFLDYAAELLFLQKTGGSYIFTHRLLMEYFAGLQPEAERAEPAKAAPDDELAVQV